MIASSTGSELSQESPELGGSYFTHHLAVGLRGAADIDRDGRVTLREAYEYAYNNTLIATAMTAVGRQHPVLETRLKGQGDVVLSYPAEASAHLELVKGEPTALLVSTDHDVVVAELHAPSDRGVRLALPPGEYIAFARRGDVRYRCGLTLAAGAVTEVDPSQCAVVPLSEGSRAKGASDWNEGWGFELGLGLRFPIDDGYVLRIQDFGYDAGFDLTEGFRVRGSVVRRIVEHASGVLSVGLLDRRSWRRSTASIEQSEIIQSFDFSVWSAVLVLSGRLELELGAGFETYAQAGAGIAWGTSALGDVGEGHVAPTFAVGAGLAYRLTEWGALYLQLGWSTARVVSNLAGDTHGSGGLDNVLGFRVDL